MTEASSGGSSTLLLASLALLLSALISSWQLVAHEQPRINRPTALRGGGGLVAILLWLTLLVAGVVMFWRGVGWLAGIGAFVMGFWLLRIPFRLIFRAQHQRD